MNTLVIAPRLPRLPASAVPHPAGRPAPGRREPFFDNVKVCAIVLVVAGHGWEPLTGENRVVQALYLTVYAFHMPAFVFVSGYFSRSFDGRPDRARRLVTGVVVPYVVFETGYSLFRRYLGNSPDHPVSLLDPWYLTWFLVALFVWRVTSPVWRVVRWPVPVAVAVAVLATTSRLGDTLDLQRVLQFLPFFVLGLTLRPGHLALVRSRAVRTAAAPVFAVALGAAYAVAPRVDRSWLYHRDGSTELGVSPLAGAVVTLAVLAGSAVLALAFLALVPARRLWCTGLGSGTLYAFLLHGFVVQAARSHGWYDGALGHPVVGPVTVTVLAAGVALGLCTGPVRAVFRPVVEPRLDWAFTPGTGRARRRAGGAVVGVAAGRSGDA